MRKYTAAWLVFSTLILVTLTTACKPDKPRKIFKCSVTKNAQTHDWVATDVQVEYLSHNIKITATKGTERLVMEQIDGAVGDPVNMYFDYDGITYTCASNDSISMIVSLYDVPDINYTNVQGVFSGNMETPSVIRISDGVVDIEF